MTLTRAATDHIATGPLGLTRWMDAIARGIHACRAAYAADTQRRVLAQVELRLLDDAGLSCPERPGAGARLIA